MTFEERCRLSEQCLPEAPYREMLTKLHDEMLEALAQPQQEPLEYWNAVEGWVKLEEAREHLDSVGCGTIYKTAGEGRVPLCIAQPQQEPVAFEPNDADLLEAFTRSNNGPNPFYRCNTCGDIEPGLREYLLAHWLMHNNTSPPAQRTWVGLTDEDRAQCVQATVESGEALQLMSCIEAKLREKNT